MKNKLLLNYYNCLLVISSLSLFVISMQSSIAAAVPSDDISVSVSSGVITTPMKKYSKPSANYVSTAVKNKGSIKFLLNMANAGDYNLLAKVKSPTDSRNSFFLKVNDSKTYIWNLPISKAYSWVEFSQSIHLPAGTTSIIVSGREPRTELAELKIIKSTKKSPTPSPTPKVIPTIATSTPTPNSSSPTPNSPNPGLLNPNLAPAQNFNLSQHWKLTLPIDSSGGFTGGAIEIKPIPFDYQQPHHFYTAKDGSMVFVVNTDGATTKGSSYPRSELREMKDPSTNAAWTIAEGGNMEAVLSVNELPTTNAGEAGRIVIGQIHGDNNELCRLYYDKGRLYFYDDRSGESAKETQFILKSSDGQPTNIQLNDLFAYSINVSNNRLTVSAVHNNIVYSESEPISPYWLSGVEKFYFKAGAYLQVGKSGSKAGTQGTGRGMVSFYSLPPPTH